MTEKKMLDYFEQLRPAQRQFIFWCINRKKVPEHQIQPGLFPFVTAQQAVEALQDRMDDEMFFGAGGNPTTLDNVDSDKRVCNSRYIRHLISVLSEGVDLKRYRDQSDIIAKKDSTIMHLNAMKVRRLAKRHFATFFTIDSIHIDNSNVSTAVEFVQRSPQTWLITVNAKYLDRITTLLAEQCR